MRFRGLLSVCIAAGLLVFGAVGCGDDDSGDSGSTTAASPPPAGSTATPPPSGTPVSGEIAGAGASSQAAAQDAWIAGFSRNRLPFDGIEPTELTGHPDDPSSLTSLDVEIPLDPSLLRLEHPSDESLGVLLRVVRVGTTIRATEQ